MPVTAKLSRKFYDTFGDEIANELVEWFNQVDSTYRADLRELNELNFARFDAKLEQRITQSEAKLERRISQVESKLEQHINQVEAKLEQRINQVDAKLDRLESRLIAALSETKAELMKWTFGSVFAAWITLLGIILTKVH